MNYEFPPCLKLINKAYVSYLTIILTRLFYALKCKAVLIETARNAVKEQLRRAQPYCCSVVKCMECDIT